MNNADPVVILPISYVDTTASDVTDIIDHKKTATQRLGDSILSKFNSKHAITGPYKLQMQALHLHRQSWDPKSE